MSANGFDLAPLLEAVGGDKEIMSQVISMFVTTTRENLEAIHEAIQKQDAKAVKTTAHHLKGSLLELGAVEAVSMALDLEKMGMAAQLTGAESIWQKLDVCIRDLVNALEQTEYRRSA